MYKVVNRLALEYLVELLPDTVKDMTSYNLRNEDAFDVFGVQLEQLRNSLYPNCVRQWNN